MTKTCVVAAGGTGGHMFPAEALARTLAARGWRVILATDHRGEAYAHAFPAEERMALDAATGRGPIGMLKAVLTIGKGVIQARKVMDRATRRVVSENMVETLKVLNFVIKLVWIMYLVPLIEFL